MLMKNYSKTSEFAIDSNVHIEVISPQNIIRQTVDKHNRATRYMLEGILGFLRGDFNTSYRQQIDSKVKYKNMAKNYIPCYVNFGTGGIVIDDITKLPKHGTTKRDAVTTDDWQSDNNYVRTRDISLDNEIGASDESRSRIEISVLSTDNKDKLNNIDTDLTNSMLQFVFDAVAPTGHCNIYGITEDAFVTEIGLFASPAPGTKDLLARVILKKTEDILYIRPQDTVVVTWVISVIALNDQSTYQDIENDDNIYKIDSLITDTIEGTITIDDDVNTI